MAEVRISCTSRESALWLALYTPVEISSAPLANTAPIPLPNAPDSDAMITANRTVKPHTRSMLFTAPTTASFNIAPSGFAWMTLCVCAVCAPSFFRPKQPRIIPTLTAESR